MGRRNGSGVFKAMAIMVQRGQIKLLIFKQHEQDEMDETSIGRESFHLLLFMFPFHPPVPLFFPFILFFIFIFIFDERLQKMDGIVVASSHRGMTWPGLAWLGSASQLAAIYPPTPSQKLFLPADSGFVCERRCW